MDRRTLLRSAFALTALPIAGGDPTRPRALADALARSMPLGSAGTAAVLQADRTSAVEPTRPETPGPTATAAPTAAPTQAPTPEPTAAPTAAPLPRLAAYDDAMRTYMGRVGAPAAALAVVRDGRLVHHGTYGVLSDGSAPGTASRWRVASLAKMWTASAVRTLVAQGRLAYDTRVYPLAGVQPAGSPDPRLGQITVRHLLEHSGGWDAALSGDPMFDSRHIAQTLGVASPPSFAQTAAYVLGRPLDFDPGSRSAYSNFGYGLLGLVLAKSTGLTYADAVAKLVLSRSGATAMTLGATRERSAGEVDYRMPAGTSLAWSVFDPAAWVPWPYGGFALEPMAAHGGWISSALDLARYARSLDERRGDAVPRPESSPIPTSAGYAYWYANLGSLPGAFSVVRRDWDGAHYTAACGVFNSRSGNGSLDNAIVDDLRAAAQSVAAWPSGIDF